MLIEFFYFLFTGLLSEIFHILYHDQIVKRKRFIKWKKQTGSAAVIQATEEFFKRCFNNIPTSLNTSLISNSIEIKAQTESTCKVLTNNSVLIEKLSGNVLKSYCIRF
jgi:hypothetical protein